MYIACKISKNEIIKNDEYNKIYKTYCDYRKNHIIKKHNSNHPPKIELDKYFIEKYNEQTILSGEQIIEDNFPNVKNADVFISHSHLDKIYAYFLKYYLKIHFKLNCFIDSLVWHNAFDLLKNVDEYFSKKGENLYDYDKRNQTTSNIFIMLANALSYMIDKCPIVIFISSENSQVSYQDSMVLQDKTYSPWLFHEISMVHLLPRKEPPSPVATESRHNKVATDLRLKIEYPVGVSDLPTLTFELLNQIEDEVGYYDDIIKAYNAIIKMHNLLYGENN